MIALLTPGVQKLIDQAIENTGSEMHRNDQVAASILQYILQKDKGLVVPVKSRKSIFSYWIREAAAVIIFVTGVTY